MTADRLHFEKQLWATGRTLIAGVDEAGRGPLAGPVVAAAVVFPVGFWLEAIDDSKKLTPREREHLLPLIQANAVSIGVGVVGHELIDRMNIYRASIAAMQEAVAKLSPQPELILADGNSFHHGEIPFTNIIQGDARSMTIGAASIVAKVHRDRLMAEFDELYPAYGFRRHKGYATKQHLEAIMRHGFCDIHRRSFHPKALAHSPEALGELEPKEA